MRGASGCVDLRSCISSTRFCADGMALCTASNTITEKEVEAACDVNSTRIPSKCQSTQHLSCAAQWRTLQTHLGASHVGMRCTMYTLMIMNVDRYQRTG